MNFILWLIVGGLVGGVAIIIVTEMNRQQLKEKGVVERSTKTERAAVLMTWADDGGPVA